MGSLGRTGGAPVALQASPDDPVVRGDRELDDGFRTTLLRGGDGYFAGWECLGCGRAMRYETALRHRCG